ncbi:hypothetical protein [Pleomorphovibrio marinus]|uniref:hypothetical protein n=1 Tax=Pleomorphovibrio marinus TaxID=2164132 RepID=UPI000E0A8BED|nr:hypothetical protein [Pleomorphovibrio marinus]
MIAKATDEFSHGYANRWVAEERMDGLNMRINEGKVKQKVVQLQKKIGAITILISNPPSVHQ